MSMLKITETSNQLVWYSQSPFSIALLSFKVALIVPLAIAVGFYSRLGVESLNCQRHDADGINCVQKKTAWMGLKSLPEHSFTSISHAEYMQREEPTNDEDSPCSTITYHEFYLMGKANWREQVFKPLVPIRMGCSVGNSGWIQEQVQNFNTSEAERFTIKQDTRLAPSQDTRLALLSILVLGFCLSSVIFITDLSDIKHPRKFEFDRTTRMFRLIEYTWWVSPKTVMSSGFADLRVGLQSEEDDDSILYSITLMSKTGKPVFLDYSSDRQSMQEEANKIARFIGKKVEEIAPGNGATATVTEKAQELLEYHEQLYSQTHKFVRVNAQDFSHLDLKFYEQAQKELEGLGFEKLADIEDKTISEADPNQPRIMIRMMLSRDRRTVAGIYAIPLPGLVKVLQAIGLFPKGGKTVELESEFEGGTFLTTSNTQGLDNSAPVPGIERQQLPGTAAISEVVKQHRLRVKAINAETPALMILNFEQAIAMQDCLQTLKNKHKQAQGYLTRDDIQRHTKKGQEEAAEALGDALDRLKTPPSPEQ